MGQQGYLRVPQINIFGAFGSILAPIASKIQILIGYDYEQPTRQVVWDPKALLFPPASAQFGSTTPGDGAVAQFRAFTPPGPRGGTMESISFTISDTVDPNNPNDPGFAFDMVSAAIRRLGGLYRLGPSRSTG